MTYPIGLVGESNYQLAVRRCRTGEIIELAPEPGNRHDTNAVVALNRSGDTIGYLPRDGWLTRCIVDEGKDVFATIKSVAQPAGASAAGIVLDVAIGEDAAEQRRLHKSPKTGWLGRLFGRG